MFKVKLKDGRSYSVTEALAKAMRENIENKTDKVVYHDKINGSFMIKTSDIQSIEL
jgi:hypothetical protein